MSLSNTGKELLFKHRLNITKHGRIGKNEDNNSFQLHKLSLFVDKEHITPGQAVQYAARCNQSNLPSSFQVNSSTKYTPFGNGESLSCIDAFLESWMTFKKKGERLNKPDEIATSSLFISFWVIILICFLLGFLLR